MARKDRTSVYSRGDRDKFAQAMASFMRKEIGDGEFIDATLDKNDYASIELEMHLLLYYIDNDCYRDEICVNPEGWDLMRRFIAFLKTDYGITQKTPRLFSITPFVPLLFLVTFTATAIIAWQTGRWQELAIVWLTLGVIENILDEMELARNEKLLDKDAEFGVSAEARKFMPFLSQEDWQKHQHLLEQYALPDYDPKIHGRWIKPPDTGKRHRAWRWMMRIFGRILALPICLLVDLLGFDTYNLTIYLRTEKPLSEPEAAATNA